MGGHAALAGTTHAVALLGVGQDHRRLPGVRLGGCIGGMDLHQVVAAALEPIDLLIGHALRELSQGLALSEEVLAVVLAVARREGLHFAVDRVGEGVCQRTGEVACKKAVPVAAPDQLDHIPAGSGKQALKLVDDATVATHRAIEALQIAVDHPDQIVEVFAGGQCERAHRLGLVHLTITEDAPDFSTAAVEQLAIGEVVHESGVVDRADRTDAHRSGGELPEVGHQPGVRIARQAAGAAADAMRRRSELLAIVVEVGFAQAPLEECAGIHAGRTVRLKEHEIAAVVLRAGPKEVIETHLKEIGCTGIARDMPAELAIGLVGAHDHRQRVPAHQRAQPLLDRQIAREGCLPVDRN